MASFSAETIIQVGSFPITNTILNTLLVDAAILGGVFALNKKLSMIPNKFQNAVEIIMETFYDLTKSVAQNRASRIFPYFMTFFLFILIANWSGLIPGVGTVGFF